MLYTVVVIEDEPLLLRALTMELLRNDFKVFSAMDGITGLQLIKEKKPNMVLLDLILPKMSGYQILATLKKLKKTQNIPVIVLSNLEEKEDTAKSLELGAIDHFTKSNTNLQTIVSKIKKRLKIA